MSRVSKHSSSFIKMKPDVVYDVPLLRSLQQQLCDRHILKEVILNTAHTISSHTYRVIDA